MVSEQRRNFVDIEGSIPYIFRQRVYWVLRALHKIAYWSVYALVTLLCIGALIHGDIIYGFAAIFLLRRFW